MAKIAISDVDNLRSELDSRITAATLRTVLRNRVTTTQLQASLATVSGDGGTDLTDLQNQVDDLSNSVDNKAAQDDLDAVSETVSDLSTTVSSKADQDALDDLADQFNSASLNDFPVFVNVKDYGAVGDGVADDTAAIKAAIEAVNVTDGSGPRGMQYATYDWYNRMRNTGIALGARVYLPAGVYRITESLRIVGHVEVVGDGVGTLIFAELPEGSLTETGAFVAHQDGIGECQQAAIRNMDIWTQFGHGIDLRGGALGLIVEGVNISAAGWGIYSPEYNSYENDGTGSYLQACHFRDIQMSQCGCGMFFGTGNLCTIERLSGSGSGVRTEVQLLTIVGTGGTYTLTFDHGGTPRTTSSLNWNASAATVQSALEALVNIGAGNLTVEQVSWNGSNIRVLRVIFSGNSTALARQDLPTLTASSSLTGPGAGVTPSVGMHGWVEPNIQRSEIVGLNITASGGTFTLSVEGGTTGSLNHNADAATIKAALDALGKGTWTVTAGSGYTWRLVNTLGRRTSTMTLASSLTGGTATLTTRQKGYTDKAMIVIKGSGWQTSQLHVETSADCQAVKISGIGPVYAGFSTAGVIIDNPWIENEGDAIDNIVWYFDTCQHVEVRRGGNTSWSSGLIYIRDVSNVFFDRLYGSKADGDYVAFDPLDASSVLDVGYIFDGAGHDTDRSESRIIVHDGLYNQYNQFMDVAPQSRMGNLLYPNPTTGFNGATAALTYENVANIGWCWKLTWSSNPSNGRLELVWPFLRPSGFNDGQTSVYLSGILILGSPDPNIQVVAYYGLGGAAAYVAKLTRTGPFLIRWPSSPGLNYSSASIDVRTTAGTYGTIYFKNLAATVGGRFQAPPAAAMVTYHADGRIETSGSAAPTTGTWTAGSVCHNTAPASGGPPGWVCTAAGTPGTWKAMANLA